MRVDGDCDFTATRPRVLSVTASIEFLHAILPFRRIEIASITAREEKEERAES